MTLTDEALLEKFYGREIRDAALVNGRLQLTFIDGVILEIWDNADYCCEKRYVTTDDDLIALIGTTLYRIEVKDGPTTEEGGSDHETMFVEIQTDGGFVTLTTHNEHNGYYGGFSLQARMLV